MLDCFLDCLPCPQTRINDGMLCGCRATLQEQLFLLSETFQPIILELRQRCVALWRLRLHGVHAGHVYTLQALQDVQDKCMQASVVVHGLEWSEVQLAHKLKASRVQPPCRRHKWPCTALLCSLQALLPEAQHRHQQAILARAWHMQAAGNPHILGYQGDAVQGSVRLLKQHQCA